MMMLPTDESADLSAMDTEASDSDSRGRQLRRAYRTLINGTVSNTTETMPLTATLTKAKELFDKVTRVQEAALDSELVLLLASRARKAASTLPVNIHTFDPDDFLSRLRNYMGATPGHGPVDLRAWANLGKQTQYLVKASAPLWYLYGSAGQGPPRPPPAPRTRIVETGNKAATVPSQVRSTDKTNKETTTERVEHIHKALKDLYQVLKRPLPYIELVVHPSSFAKTCENIFHTSFLVNEGHANIFKNEAGELMVEPVNHKNSIQLPTKKENVFVMTVTTNDWRKAVAALRLTEPAIPDS